MTAEHRSRTRDAGSAAPYLRVDQPTWVQLAKYIWSVMRFDLGFSYRQNAPVLDVILQQLPATLILMLSATAVALLVGVTPACWPRSRSTASGTI